jgi:hypothetical protein
MGVYDDYVNGLEGKSDLDVLAVVKDLTKLHNEEISTWDAKVQTQNSLIAERDTALADKENEVVKYKAMNLDLTMQIPGDAQKRTEDAPKEDSPEARALTITPDDLFA